MSVPYHTHRSVLTERVEELLKDFFNDLAKTFLYKLLPENDKKNFNVDDRVNFLNQISSDFFGNSILEKV